MVDEAEDPSGRGRCHPAGHVPYSCGGRASLMEGVVGVRAESGEDETVEIFDGSAGLRSETA